jgi:tetratricopeptide (TPR) repeat protein
MTEWSNFRYKAFISYSHDDEKWARWLHKSLETYRIPRHVVGQKTSMGKVPQRLAPVFRDREELATATDLGDKLREALDGSACLIVICSPASARSHWVNEEILAFKRLGRAGRIFSLIVDGEPYASQRDPDSDQECFPLALQYQLNAEGELGTLPAEPIAADARHGKDGRSNARVKLIAGMLGLGFDDLRQRELQRRNRRLAVITSSAVIGMVFAIGLATTAVIARNEAERQRVRAEAEAETARQTASFLVSLFEVSDPSESRGETITAREILSAGAERIDTELSTQPQIQARLMDTIGSVYSSLGLFKDARSMLEKALANRRVLPGVSQQEIVETMLHMAYVDTVSAEMESAEKLYAEAIERLNSAGASDGLEMTDARAGLAELYYQMGRFEEAEPLLTSVLEDRRRILGDVDPAVADAIEELGLNQYDQGKLEDAEQYLRESLVMRRQLLGDRPHPDLAENIFNLAFVLNELGRYEEVEARYLEAMGMLRRLYGEKHPTLVTALANLGSMYRVQGYLDKARQVTREALAMSQDLFTEMHPQVAMVLLQLSYVAYDAGRREEAIELSRRALAIQKETLGVEHPEVALNMTTLGRWLGESGASSEGEEMLRNALEIYSGSHSQDHPDVARAQVELADLLTTQGRYDESLHLAKEGTASLVKVFGADHWLTASGVSVEGGALVGLGRLEEAEPRLRSSYEQLRRDEGARRVYVQAARLRLKQFYEMTGREAEAATLSAPAS